LGRLYAGYKIYGRIAIQKPKGINMRKLLLITCILCTSDTFAINPDISGCIKEESIDLFSDMHAMFQFCGFDKQPRQRELLQKLEQTNNEQCNFAPNEIKPDQQLIEKKLISMKKNHSIKDKELSKSCDGLHELLQQTAKEYDESNKPKYTVGSFDDPNIPVGYKQICSTLTAHLNGTNQYYQDAYHGRTPLALVDKWISEGLPNPDIGIPYPSHAIYRMDMDIKKAIFSDKNYAPKFAKFIKDAEFQCLKDIKIVD
jgi:hypothetical protein